YPEVAALTNPKLRVPAVLADGTYATQSAATEIAVSAPASALGIVFALFFYFICSLDSNVEAYLYNVYWVKECAYFNRISVETDINQHFSFFLLIHKQWCHCLQFPTC
ncbi:hypothetical protein ACJX0J_012938, partial [Zea mays]